MQMKEQRKAPLFFQKIADKYNRTIKYQDSLTWGFYGIASTPYCCRIYSFVLRIVLLARYD